jgi:hypothetical protein
MFKNLYYLNIHLFQKFPLIDMIFFLPESSGMRLCTQFSTLGVVWLKFRDYIIEFHGTKSPQTSFIMHQPALARI